jgi:hypothetical protein
MGARSGPVKVREHELFLWQKSVAVMLQKAKNELQFGCNPQTLCFQ